MKNYSDIRQGEQNNQALHSNGLDLLVMLPLILKNWYWFIIGVLVALFLARIYINHTMPVYRTSTTILIDETEERPIVDNSQLLQGLGLPGGMKNLENQIMILKSRALTERTLKELPFEIEFYFKTLRNSLPIYPEIPIKVIYESEIPLPMDTEFSISFNGKRMYTIESEVFSYHKTAYFDEPVVFEEDTFRVECWNANWLDLNKDQKVYFTIHSPASLINYFSGRINVELVSREGSILRISLEGTNIERDVDFLNKHIEGFQTISLDKKNIEASRRIQFIDDQLVGISDSLSTTENRLQQFRSAHKVMDLSAQGQSLIGQVTLLENEKARLNLEANYYDYLADYLSKGTSTEIPIVPITMGITDPGLTRLVEELAELQGQLSARGAGEKNPLQRNLEQRVRTTKDALRETLNGLRRANSLARSENQEQINRANAQASALPVTERQLLGIERKFRLNDELYTFLLETRAEQEMQKASNRANSEVIDPADARFSAVISPNRAMIFLVALFIGFVFPLLTIYLTLLFNKKLKDEDIRKMTKIPIVGNIPHNVERSNTVVFDDPTSTIAEAFRLLRSKMQFFIKDNRVPTILITSTMPEDGKTFTAINLASVYSLLGKKTILIGYDLRKPKIFNDFNLTNEKGVSTWLIGEDGISDIIQETSFKNLSVIPAGPLPPNPSELTALSKTAELLKVLKEAYDYIIIDSSPIGIVSDTFHLASLADVTLLVTRPGKTLRDMLENTLHEINTSNIKGVGLVINDIQVDGKTYGYGSKYGYTNDKGKSRKRMFKRQSLIQ